jgi:putative ABC transport system permease protein
LLSDLLNSSTAARPALFLFDIQAEQLEPLEALLAKNHIEVSQTAPFVRGRILQVNGEKFERSTVRGWETREQESDARMRNRGINLSYREKLHLAEKITAGKPWSEMSSSPLPEISVETGYADRLKLKLGDQLLFDIQGIEMKAQIASLRTVDWESFEPNFYILFPLGVIDAAPKTWILTLHSPGQLSAPQIQALISKDFPSVTSINVKEAIESISALFGKLAGGLRLASALCLALGIFVFLMILLFQMASSRRDGMQLKILGLNSRQILGVQLLTYGGLALQGGLLGLVMSLALAWGLAHFAFATTLSIDWTMTLAVFALSLLLALVGMALLAWRQASTGRLSELIGE